MKIIVLGWYGTETIGDRAILVGIFSFFSKVFNDFEIHIGSLFPFFTQRTVVEDSCFYKKVLNKDIDIKIFDSSSAADLNKNLIDSDFVVMGGGPLMDLSQLYMIEYAFKKAQKLKIKTALLGCGIGPLFKDEYKQSVVNIYKNSDIVILRDNQSKLNLRYIINELDEDIGLDRVEVGLDPAVEITRYLENNDKEDKKYIAVNLREFPSEYSKKNIKNDIDKKLFKFIESLSNSFKDYEIRLIPMHYFHIGNDDRVFLNSIALKLNKSNIIVQNKNLSLEETMAIYKNATYNVGMRFHSVVLQTLLNGNNYILDYTEPDKGKIHAFIQDVDKCEFYKNRYINLQRDDISFDFTDNKFKIDNKILKNYSNIYVEAIKRLTIKGN